jgi:hypothetical protein
MQREYMLECSANENPIYKEIVDIIYKRMLERMQAGTAHPSALKTVVACVKHIREGSSQDRAVVVKWAEGICAGETKSERRAVQLSIIDLLRSGFFGEEVEGLSQLVTKPYF